MTFLADASRSVLLHGTEQESEEKTVYDNHRKSDGSCLVYVDCKVASEMKLTLLSNTILTKNQSITLFQANCAPQRFPRLNFK